MINYLYYAILSILSLGYTVPSNPGLYISTDKLIYNSTDKIWFTGMLTTLSMQDTSLVYHTLYVSVVDPDSKRILQSGRFPIDQGLIYGALEIPDTVKPKEYILIGYTNNYANNAGEHLFVKAISINAPLRRGLADEVVNERHGRIRIGLSADSMQYHTRSRSRWKVHLSDSAGNPLAGIFSFSAVATRRSPSSLATHIDTYVGDGFKEVLTPELLARYGGIDRPGAGSLYTKKGAYHQRRSLLYRSGAGQMVTIETDSSGQFLIDPTDMIAPVSGVGRSFLSWIGRQKRDTVKIRLQAQEDSLTSAIAGSERFRLVKRSLKELPSPFGEEGLPVVTLKEVVAVAREPLIDGFRVVVDSSCTPLYMCVNGHVNCLALPNEYPAITGKTYFDRKRGVYIKYMGCPDHRPRSSASIVLLKPLLLPDVFPAPDFGQEIFTEKMLGTTLHWNYLVVTDANGDAEISFYTNDLTGLFTVTIEGMTVHGSFSMRKDFEVK